MAWSNRNREPRREWTEQGFGLIALVLYSYLCWYLSSLLPLGPGNPPRIVDFALLLVFNTITIFLGFIILNFAWLLVHAAGEVFCDVLRVIGLDPRPTRRYG
jgi:hypothetical protein